MPQPDGLLFYFDPTVEFGESGATPEERNAYYHERLIYYLSRQGLREGAEERLTKAAWRAWERDQELLAAVPGPDE